jgi:hypothetical protein
LLSPESHNGSRDSDSRCRRFGPGRQPAIFRSLMLAAQPLAAISYTSGMVGAMTWTLRNTASARSFARCSKTARSSGSVAPSYCRASSSAPSCSAEGRCIGRTIGMG